MTLSDILEPEVASKLAIDEHGLACRCGRSLKLHAVKFVEDGVVVRHWIYECEGLVGIGFIALRFDEHDYHRIARA